MSVWRTMGVAGWTKLIMLLHARYTFLPPCMLLMLVLSLNSCQVRRSNCIYMRMQDTFRGRVCECPIVRGVKFVGDGYTHCEGTL
jgi:hypothetical protein